MTTAVYQIDNVIDHEGRAFLIGLDNKTDTVPSVQFRRKTQGLQQIERYLQTTSLFGIDIQANVVAARQDGVSALTRGDNSAMTRSRCERE